MNIVVLFGGESCEHDISIITGVQLLNNINKDIYNVIPIYIKKDGTWWTGESLFDIDNFPNYLKDLKEITLASSTNCLYIKKKKKMIFYKTIDMCFLCLHGKGVEDGVVSGILENSKIPYSSSSILASSICMDKIAFKTFCKGCKIPVVEGMCLRKEIFEGDKKRCLESIQEFGLPIIIKPARQGSSIGIKVCKDIKKLEEMLEYAFLYDEKLLIEKFIDIEKEINIAIVKNKDDLVLSSTEEPKYSSDILGFDEKYKKKGFESISRLIPADIDKKTTEKVENIAKKLYVELEMFGIVRFDFILDKSNHLYVNEVNTIPGSMANYLFKDKLKYSKLIDMVILNSLLRKEIQDKYIKTFDSGVLNQGFTGFKK